MGNLPGTARYGAITHEPIQGSITLSWPDTGVFSLHRTASLTAPATWTPVPGTPVLNAGTWSLSVSAPAAPLFFRLHYP